MAHYEKFPSRRLHALPPIPPQGGEIGSLAGVQVTRFGEEGPCPSRRTVHLTDATSIEVGCGVLDPLHTRHVVGVEFEDVTIVFAWDS